MPFDPKQLTRGILHSRSSQLPRLVCKIYISQRFADSIIEMYVVQNVDSRYSLILHQVRRCLWQLLAIDRSRLLRRIVIIKRRFAKEILGIDRAGAAQGEVEENSPANPRWLGNWPIFGRAGGQNLSVAVLRLPERGFSPRLTVHVPRLVAAFELFGRTQDVNSFSPSLSPSVHPLSVPWSPTRLRNSECE